MSYDYDEPEVAAIDLLEGNEEVIHYGMVTAKWSEEKDGAVVFIDMDSGNSVGKIENTEMMKMYEKIVTMLVKTDEEIRSEL